MVFPWFSYGFWWLIPLPPAASSSRGQAFDACRHRTPQQNAASGLARLETATWDILRQPRKNGDFGDCLYFIIYICYYIFSIGFTRLSYFGSKNQGLVFHVLQQFIVIFRGCLFCSASDGQWTLVHFVPQWFSHYCFRMRKWFLAHLALSKNIDSLGPICPWPE